MHTLLRLISFPALAAFISLVPAPTVVAQGTSWINLDYRQGHAMANDAGRGALVMFGGAASSGLLDDTWEHTAAGWTERQPGYRPPARASHGMVYTPFPTHSVSLLFGGTTTTGRSNETWEWDGNYWTFVRPLSAPSARDRHAMVFDTVRQRALLFGGYGAAGAMNDLWEWDGTDWRLVITQSPPSARFGHAMVFNPATNRILLFGGSGFSSETWEYAPSTRVWTQILTAPGNTPPGRVDTALAYDPLTQQIVLFGGSRSATQVLNDTWIWNGALPGWVLLAPPTMPPARTGHRMEFDASSGAYYLVLLGGVDAVGDPLPYTWRWTGADWALASPSPIRRFYPGIAYDSIRDRVVLFGGNDGAGNAAYADTWSLEGFSWTRRLPLVVPQGRVAHMMTFDAARGEVVMYGGDLNGGGCPDLSDTWVWNGTTWIQRFPSTVPGLLGNGAMVYDSTRREVLMVGNGDGCFGGTGLWAWNGSNWSLRAGLPRTRFGIGICAAYDPTRDRLVVFGGFTSSSILGDETWEWDGTTWFQRFPATVPPPRIYAAMDHDLARRRTVLFSGQDAAGRRNDTWEWDGTTWSQVFVNTPPQGRDGARMTYDVLRSRLIMFGGSDENSTWAYVANRRAQYRAFDTGCAGSRGVPTLSAAAPSLPWIGETLDIRATNLPLAQFGFLLIGFSERDWLGLPLPFDLSPIGMPGCRLLTDPTVMIGFATGNGTGSLLLPLPNDPALAGAHFYNQALIVDPGINPGGATTSNGRDAMIGIRL